MAKSYGKIYKNKSNVSITPFDIYKLYTIGSIYITLNNDNPSIYFGGEWEQIKGRFLLGAGAPDDNSNNWYGSNLTSDGINRYNEPLGSTGGESRHILSIIEMPKHYHRLEYYINNGNNMPGGFDKFLAYGMPAGSQYYTSESYAGGGDSHNNMPPYLAVNMWKRIA